MLVKYAAGSIKELYGMIEDRYDVFFRAEGIVDYANALDADGSVPSVCYACVDNKVWFMLVPKGAASLITLKFGNDLTHVHTYDFDMFISKLVTILLSDIRKF